MLINVVDMYTKMTTYQFQEEKNKIQQNLEMIFKDDKRTVTLALDHGYFEGPIKGLKNLEDIAKIKELLKECDAFSLTKGLYRKVFYDVDKPMILRISGGNSLEYDDPMETKGHSVETSDKINGSLVERELANEDIVTSVEEAVTLDAVGVSVSIYVGSKYQKQTITNLGRVADEVHKHGRLLLGITAVGKNLKRDARYLGLASRIAVEHGADIVKTYYCEDGFDQVVNACLGVPVIIAGGKTVGPKQVFDMTYNAIQGGASGVDMGRNIFQADNPSLMLYVINKIVHHNLSLLNAFSVFDALSHKQASPS